MDRHRPVPPPFPQSAVSPTTAASLTADLEIGFSQASNSPTSVNTPLRTQSASLIATPEVTPSPAPSTAANASAVMSLLPPKKSTRVNATWPVRVMIRRLAVVV